MAKRLAVLVLTVILVISCIPSSMLALADNSIFSDDFSSENMQGWSDNKAGTIQDGYYISQADAVNVVTTIGEQKDVSVSAKVSVAVTTKNNGFKTGTTAYVCAREAKDGSYGYEFGIGVSKDGTTFVRLYARNANAVSKTLYQTTDKIEGVGVIAQNTEYTITLATTGQNLYCLINNVLVYETEDETFTSGYVGMKSVSGKAQFDEFKAQKVPSKKIETITVTEHQTEVSRTEKLYFTLNVQYNSVYGSEILNQDSKGVTFSGLDGTTGKKQVVVSYGGKSAKFSVNVIEKKAQKVLYSNDFSDNSLEGWTGGTKTYEEQGFTYKYGAKNGYVYINAPELGNITPPAYLCSIGAPIDEAAQYNNYSVEVKAAIDTDSKSATTKPAVAALIFAKQHKLGENYEFRISSNGTIYIYCDGEKFYTTTFTKTLGEDFQYGRYYTLRADVYEGCAQLYLNNTLIYTLADFGDPLTDAKFGMLTMYGTVRYDDLKAITLEQKGAHAVKSMAVVNTATGKEIGNRVLNRFDLKQYVILATYIDGIIQPVKIAEDMLSVYDKESTKLQTVTVTYGNKKYSFKYKYEDYLFKDDFTDGLDGLWSMGASEYTTTSFESGRLQFKYNSKQTESSGSLTGYLKEGTEWTNYSVSADVYLDLKGNSNSKTRIISIPFRRVNSSTYYEFRILMNSVGTMTAQLRRTVDGETVRIRVYDSNQLRACLDEGQFLGAGVAYNIRVDAIDNRFALYFNNHRIDTYVDDSGMAILNGTTGIKVASNNCYVDNYIVRVKEAAQITDLKLSNVDDGIYEVWRGNDIAVWEHSLIVTYSDKTKEEIPLTEKHIGSFDNNEVGKHTVTLQYEGFEDSIQVVVKERPDYIKDFIAALNDFPKKVTQSNLEDFEELKEYYDTLTPYEVSTLTEKQLKKYEKLIVSYDVLRVPELKGQDMISSADFSGSDTRLWSDSYEGNMGVWKETNGIYYEAQRSYGRFGTGWKCPDVYGEITGMSADCLLLNDEMHMGLGINLDSGAGYYHTRITTTAVDEQGKSIYQLQLVRRTSTANVRVEVLATEAYDHYIDTNQWFNLTLTLEGRTVRVYLDGDLLITYEETDKVYDLGDACLRISEGDGLYDNVRVYGTKMDRPVDANNIEPTFYTDDFEDETVGTNPSHWLEQRSETVVSNDWRVVQKNNSKVYATEQKKNTITYLHAFDNNPKISADFMVSGLSKHSRVGFLTRMAPTTAYVKIMYDYAVQKWCVVYAESRAVGDTILYQDERFKLEEGKWYSAEIIENERNITFKIDGKEILSFDSIVHDGYGRVGFCTESANMYVDNYKVELSSGDIPQDGVETCVINPSTYSGYMEIESLDEGKNLLGVAQNFLVTSNDGGITWKNVTRDDDYSQLYYGTYSTLLKMSNGKYLQYTGTSNFGIQISDDLLHWETISNLVPADELTTVTGALNCSVHVGTATEIKMENGKSRIFFPVAFRKYTATYTVAGHYTKIYYSDDFGYTWQVSETTTKELLPGYTEENNLTWAESKIIKCSDGTLRMYYSRNRLGCMQYTESKDGGVTWSGMYQIPELQMPLSSFALFEDSYEPGTFYMVCVIGKARLGTMFPRNRNCLLRSTDGKNWEFLMNLERMNDYTSQINGRELYQILDPSLYVSKDYVHVTFGRSEYEDGTPTGTTHNEQRVCYLRIEKDKLQGRPWDGSTISDMSYPKTIELEEMPQTTFGLSDLFVCEGSIKLTDFNGNVTYEDISENCTVYSEPNMFKLGKTSVWLCWKNGTDLSYEINIVPNYNVKWDIYGEGEVDPQVKCIMEGGSKTFTLSPEKGWKIDQVYVNDEPVKVKNQQFTVSDVKEDKNITVYFAAKTIFDYVLFWVVLNLLIIVAVIFILYKKDKLKMPSILHQKFKRIEKEEK